MIESLATLFVVVVAIASLAAYVAVWDSLFERRVRTTHDIARRVPLRAFVAGAINLAFFGILTVFLVRAAGAGGLATLLWLPAGVALCGLVIGLSFGLAAMAQAVGARQLPDASPLRRTVTGAALVAIASLLPIAGWFVLAPVVLAVGTGAFVLSLFGSSEPLA